MVHRRTSQTAEGGEEEGANGEDVGGGGRVVARKDRVVEVGSNGDGDERAQEVGVDVDGFVVEPGEGLEGEEVGGGGGAISTEDKVVVPTESLSGAARAGGGDLPVVLLLPIL